MELAKHLNLTVAKAPEQTLSLSKFAGNSAFSDEENKIIKLKYSAPKICELSESELRVRVSVLILKINVITGWVLPSNEAVLTVLKDQFYKKLIEDYGSLNTDEIEYAFRQTGTTTI